MFFKKSLLVFAMSFSLLYGGEFALSSIKITASTRADHQFAASELKKHLILAGAPATPVSKGALEIFIGRPGEKSRLKPGESRYLFKNNKLYIWGDDTPRRNGTLFGVYAFLENKLKARWIFPGDEGIVIEKVKKITFKDNESFSRIPPLKWGYVRGYGAAAAAQSYVDAPEALYKTLSQEKAFAEEVRLFLLRQRMGRVDRPKYGHAFIKWADRYYKTHPEYFGMDLNGKRTLPRDKTRAKLCLSNPAVIEQIIAEWKTAGKQPTVNICPNDGTPGFCRCPECMKLDARKPGEDFYAHLTDRYLNFWNRFLKRAREEKPDIMAVTYVYSYYRHAPRRERVQYPDNLLCGLVPTLGEDTKALFDAWKKAGMKNSFLRPNDLCYRSQLLRFMEKRIYDKFQATRREFKLFGADYDAGAWSPALDLESYTAVRMIAFPEESFEKIQKDFCSGFGKAAKTAENFYNTMRPLGEKMYQSWVSNKKIRFLDDSMVRSSSDSAFIAALDKEVKKLKAFPESTLSPLEQKRFRRLKLNAEHSLYIARFTQEGQLKLANQKNRLEEAAKILWDFRLNAGKELPVCWGRAFGFEEKRFWEKTSIYHKYVLKDELNVDDPAAGWFNSFDAGSSQGWRLRNGFEKFSDKSTASGKFSVQSKKSKQEVYVISKHALPVTPGAEYAVSFETKAPAGGSFRLRVRDNTSKDLCQIRVNCKGNTWKKGSARFKVPANLKSITIYCCAKAPQGGFIDNIRLKRISEK